MKTYLVTVTVVEEITTVSGDEALDDLRTRLNRAGFDLMPAKDDDVVESENQS